MPSDPQAVRKQLEKVVTLATKWAWGRMSGYDLSWISPALEAEAIKLDRLAGTLSDPDPGPRIMAIVAGEANDVH
jgi:hypothetical protein